MGFHARPRATRCAVRSEAAHPHGGASDRLSPSHSVGGKPLWRARPSPALAKIVLTLPVGTDKDTKQNACSIPFCVPMVGNLPARRNDARRADTTRLCARRLCPVFLVFRPLVRLSSPIAKRRVSPTLASGRKKRLAISRVLFRRKQIGRNCQQTVAAAGRVRATDRSCLAGARGKQAVSGHGAGPSGRRRGESVHSVAVDDGVSKL